MTKTLFDNSLPETIRALSTLLSRDIIERNLFMRDPAGQLTFVVQDNSVSAEERLLLSKRLYEVAAPYVDADGLAVATPAELFDDALADRKIGFPTNVHVSGGDFRVRLLDRRIIGSDWLQIPREMASIPRLVFSSLKGGVGRSTALCVAASALASRGSRVLTIDMDVEAPGLGTMLLTPDTTPTLGLLDYLVESNFGRTPEELLPDLIAPSWLAAGEGVIDVLPAIGTNAVASPENVLSKIARAYIAIEGEHADGVSSRMRSLLDAVSLSRRYDVILIDARAGLHETTGAALLGLGAHVLLFGISQPQTFAAYELLLANIALVQRRDWDQWLTIVQAKADADVENLRDFESRFRRLLSKFLSAPGNNDYSQHLDLVAMRKVFDITWSEEESEADRAQDSVLSEEGENFVVTHVLESELFRSFDPWSAPDRLTPAAYAAVFGSLINTVTRITNLDGSDDVYV